LFSLPVIKAAREEANAQIYSVVPLSLAPILTSSGLVDAVTPKNEKFVKLVRTLKKEKFDKAVLFSESPSSLTAAYFSGAKERIGFKTSLLNFLLTKKVQRTGVPSLFNNRNLGNLFGLKTIQKDYVNILNIPLNNLQNIGGWFRGNKLDENKTIAISTGASKKRKNKCLEEKKWVEVIDILSAKGLNCVLSGAKWEKADLIKIAGQCKIEPKIFAAENGILDSAAFLKKCRLFVGIDSGAMHLAAAVGTKCIAVFGCTDPFQVGPMPLESHKIIKKENLEQIKSADIAAEVLEVIG
jgi:ADP-heptose:LPS heptosyltransferase